MPTRRCLDIKDPLHMTDKKASKPLMEKRRRARINHSLNQLKSLIIDPNTTDRSRQAKLEKADILELTVQHLHEIKRRQRTVSLLQNRHPRKKFEVGYSECAREVDLFLSNIIDPQTSAVDSELHRRLKQHLNRRLVDLKNIEPIGEQFKNTEIEDTCISSSSSSSNSKSPENISLTSEGCSLAESPSINRDSYSSEDLPLHSGECDTTAAFLNSIYSSSNEKVASTYSLDQNVAHGQVSSSSTESNMMFDDSDICPPSPSRNTPSYDQKESLRLADGNQLKEHSKTSQTCQRNSGEDIKNYEASTVQEHINHQNQNFKQIPLVPKHFPNGEWALVLPHDVSLGENEVHSFSAFRLVLPSGFTNFESERQRHRFVSSPSSSSVSDASSDEYFPRTNNEFVDNSGHRENFEHNFSAQFVWRPW